MKNPKVVISILLILILVAMAVGIFFFHSKRESGQELRANLSEVQKMLVTLRRAETAYQESTQGYKAVSAKKIGGKMVYSEGWNEINLPEVEMRTGFDYECLPVEGACRATEAEKTGPVADGIRIDIGTGAYSCLGAYKPVTTEGFDGALVTVACQAS
jgi:hypothetical protein